MPFQLIAGIVALIALVGGLHALVYTLKASGRAECNAEHTEAARMGELRARERTNTAAGKFEARRATNAARERTLAPEVARVVAEPAAAGTCLTPSMLQLLADDVSQHGTAAEPAGPVSATASAPAR